MKTLVAILVLAMVACAFAQVYNYGYSSHTPGARVSHYASSGYAGVPSAYYPYAGHYAGYPYRVY